MCWLDEKEGVTVRERERERDSASAEERYGYDIILVEIERNNPSNWVLVVRITGRLINLVCTKPNNSMGQMRNGV